MFFGNDYNGLATCKVTQIVSLSPSQG